MNPNKKTMFTRGLLGAVLVFFLMPFMTLSCYGTKVITMSGVTMVVGDSIKSMDPLSGRRQVQKINPEPMAIVALAAAAVALGLAFVGGAAARKATVGVAGACALSLLVLMLKVNADVSKQGKEMLVVQWEIGFRLALLASLGAVVIHFLPAKEAVEATDEPAASASST